jgi:hypothetical protein
VFPSAAALAQAAAEMKTVAKRESGGRVALDRRHATATRVELRPEASLRQS